MSVVAIGSCKPSVDELEDGGIDSLTREWRKIRQCDNPRNVFKGAKTHQALGHDIISKIVSALIL